MHLHSVAYAVAPQSVAGRNHQFVGASGLHFPCRDGRGLVLVAVLHRNELIEDANVEQEKHGRGAPVALHGEEALAGVVGVEEVHPAHVAEALVLPAVGFKGYATVEKHLQIGPHVVYAPHPAVLHHSSQHGQKPTGYAREICHILGGRRADNSGQFLLPVLHQGNLFAWHTKQIDQRVNVPDKIGREVAHPYPRREVQLIGETAAQNQAFSTHYSALRVEIQIVRHHIGASAIVISTEGIGSNGDIFALSPACATRLGKVARRTAPQHVGLATHHAHDGLAQVLVAMKRHGVGKVAVGSHGREVVAPTELGESRMLNEPYQLLLLHAVGVVNVAHLLLKAVAHGLAH